MGKPVNIVTTAHAQAAEFAALAGVSTQPADVTELQNALRAAIAKQGELGDALTREQELRGDAETKLNAEAAAHDSTVTQMKSLVDELNAEKEAHARTQAALTAATQPAA